MCTLHHNHSPHPHTHIPHVHLTLHAHAHAHTHSQPLAHAPSAGLFCLLAADLTHCGSALGPWAAGRRQPAAGREEPQLTDRKALRWSAGVRSWPLEPVASGVGQCEPSSLLSAPQIVAVMGAVGKGSWAPRCGGLSFVGARRASWRRWRVPPHRPQVGARGAVVWARLWELPGSRCRGWVCLSQAQTCPPEVSPLPAESGPGGSGGHSSAVATD